MKTNLIRTVVPLTGLTVLLAFSASLTSLSFAQEKGSARGGATLLMQKGPKQLTPTTVTTPKIMSCAQCKNEYVRKVDWQARGANKPTVLVARHLCPGCGVDWKVIGHGKAKKEVVTHICSDCGANTSACCSSDGTATEGMGTVK